MIESGSTRESHVTAVGLGVPFARVQRLDAEVEWFAVDVRRGQVVGELCVADLQCIGDLQWNWAPAAPAYCTND